MTRTLRPIVGNWAGGDSFFDREVELDDLVRRLRRGASVSLSAPRRVGKTSLLHAVRERLDPEMTCLFVDLESSATAEEAIAELAIKAQQHQALEQAALGWARWLLSATPVDLQFAKMDLRDALKIDWQTRGTRLVADLCAGEQPVVLFLDEIPVLVASLLALPSSAGRGPADLFLSWLRRLVQVPIACVSF
jgi:AAA+ ATPase superfamily predicted ATPase